MPKSQALLKIESLHPEKDAWEIIRLSLFYEFPWDFNRALEFALYKTYATPSVVNVLHRTKELENHTQKRYDDTDILLSEIIENGLKEGRGKQALEQMNKIHAAFKISNDDYIYVLSTFVFDTAFWINRYGYRKLTSNEELAGYYVWKEIGEHMHIHSIPDSIFKLKKFHDDYEAQNFIYTEVNAKVAKATENLMLSWVLPSSLFELGRPVLHAVMEPHLLKAFNYQEPPKILRQSIANLLRIRSTVESWFPRKSPYIRTKDYKHKAYPNGYTIEQLGPEKIINAAACPYHAVLNAVKQ